MSRFHAVYDKLNLALDDFPYDQLGISDEVKEQVISFPPLSYFSGKKNVALFLLTERLLLAEEFTSVPEFCRSS